jgi:hypothetical protein
MEMTSGLWQTGGVHNSTTIEEANRSFLISKNYFPKYAKIH